MYLGGPYLENVQRSASPSSEVVPNDSKKNLKETEPRSDEIHPKPNKGQS